VALLTLAVIVGIMASTLVTFVVQGNTVGLYEALFFSMTVGFGIDYVVHLAHAYNNSRHFDRSLRMKEALGIMGVSVASGAISTLLASSALFVCSLQFFTYYGSFIFGVVLWSILWALLFFPALMMTVGPNGTNGDIPMIKYLFKPWGPGQERKSDLLNVQHTATHCTTLQHTATHEMKPDLLHGDKLDVAPPSHSHESFTDLSKWEGEGGDGEKKQEEEQHEKSVQKQGRKYREQERERGRERERQREKAKEERRKESVDASSNQDSEIAIYVSGVTRVGSPWPEHVGVDYSLQHTATHCNTRQRCMYRPGLTS